MYLYAATNQPYNRYGKYPSILYKTSIMTLYPAEDMINYHVCTSIFFVTELKGRSNWGDYKNKCYYFHKHGKR